MKTQRAKFVKGQWVLAGLDDKLVIDWVSGFCRVINPIHNEMLLDCQPNYDKDVRPIPIYIVTISIEAVKENDLDLHGRYIGE